MKIGYMGFGAWGQALASLLVKNGHSLTLWARETPNKDLLPPTCQFTPHLKEALEDTEIWIESVTSKGVRPLCEQIKTLNIPLRPLIFTSKGIEQTTGFILPDVAESVLGKNCQLGVLSGPGYAEEIMKGLPASVVAAGSHQELSKTISLLFTSESFRVYPNSDMRGACLGGALKNIFAIACGISDGLRYGNGARAALMTRSLHEMVKLALYLGCSVETLYGLSGMGDLFLTCSSPLSRNYRFGSFLALGHSIETATEKVGSVVEGHYTCRSAYELSKRHQIKMPITETLYRILFERLPIKQALPLLMQRLIKEENL